MCDKQQCPICYENVVLRNLKCHPTHSICRRCIMSCEMTKCPFCRTPFPLSSPIFWIREVLYVLYCVGILFAIAFAFLAFIIAVSNTGDYIVREAQRELDNSQATECIVHAAYVDTRAEEYHWDVKYKTHIHGQITEKIPRSEFSTILLKNNWTRLDEIPIGTTRPCVVFFYPIRVYWDVSKFTTRIEEGKAITLNERSNSKFFMIVAGCMAVMSFVMKTARKKLYRYF